MRWKSMMNAHFFVGTKIHEDMVAPHASRHVKKDTAQLYVIKWNPVILYEELFSNIILP